VIVDFTNTTFIDSTTLGVLVGGVQASFARTTGQLSLVCSDRNITKIFEITGLDRVFTIYPSREEAVSNDWSVGGLVRAAVAAALAVFALASAGCSSGTGGLVGRGRRQGARQAALHGEVRRVPHARGGEGDGQDRADLDAAFASDRAQGFEDSTFRQVVADQIKYPGDYTAENGPTMPKNLVEGEDVDDVAAYVAYVAGSPKNSVTASAPPATTTPRLRAEAAERPRPRARRPSRTTAATRATRSPTRVRRARSVRISTS
jgi:hypothetical protein